MNIYPNAPLDAICHARDTSDWLNGAALGLRDRDICDALADVEALHAALTAKLAAIARATGVQP